MDDKNPQERKHTDPDLLKSHGIRVFQSAKSVRLATETEWKESEDQYNSKFSPTERKLSDVLFGQSRLFIPKTYNTIQRILADVMETFFFDEDEIVGVKGPKHVPAAKRMIVKELLNHRLTGHPIDFYKEAYEANLDALKLKYGILKVYPRLMKKGGKKEVEGEIAGQEEEVTVFEPVIECVPPEDVFLSSEATWKDYYKHPIVHRMRKDRDELKRRGFKNVDAVSSSPDAAGEDALKMARNNQSPFVQKTDVRLQEQVWVYEIWTFLDINGDGKLESVVYHMLGDQAGPSVIGKDPVENTLPYRYSEFDPPLPPFVIGYALPEPHKQDGKSFAEITRTLQREINILRNQDREAAAMAIRKPILVSTDAHLDMQALVNRKISGVVLGEDISNDGVRELSQSVPVVNTADISRRIDQDYYETSSTTPNSFGFSAREETATATQSNNFNANRSTQKVLRNLASTLMLPAFRLLLRLEQAYESDEYIERVTGERLGWAMPNDGYPAWMMIAGDFDLAVELGVNKQTQLNRYLLIADRMNQTNTGLMQLIQAGVADPKDVKLANPMWAFDRMLEVLKHKNTDDAKIAAQAAQPQAQVTTPGSQPRLVSSAESQVGQQNPEGNGLELFG